MPVTRMLVSLLLLLSAATLSGCGMFRQERPLTEVRLVDPPKAPEPLRVCEAEPPAPAPDADYQTFLDWIEAVKEAGRDCRSKHASLIQLFAP